MDEQAPSKEVDRGLVVLIVRSYVTHNVVSVDQIAGLISSDRGPYFSGASITRQSRGKTRRCTRLLFPRCRSSDRCNAIPSSTSNAAIAAKCCAGTCAASTGSTLPTIAPGGTCRPIIRSPHPAIASIVWHSLSKSALAVIGRARPRPRQHRPVSLRRPLRSGGAASRGRWPQSRR